MAWLYVALSIVLASFLYWLRPHHRVMYGISELLASVLTFVLIFVPPEPQNAPTIGEGWFRLFTFTQVVSLFVGVYAWVRGLGDISIGLREAPDWVYGNHP